MTSCNISFRGEFQLKHFKINNISCQQFQRLQWSSNPKILLGYRVIVFLYSIAWLIGDVATNEDIYYYGYFTHWGEVAMCLYFGFALYSTIRTGRSQIAAISNSAAEGHQGDGVSINEGGEELLCWHNRVVWVLFNVFITSQFLICTLYWVGRGNDLIEPNKSVIAVNVHVHIIAAMLAIIELSINDLPIRLLHFYWAISFGMVYTFFTLLLHWSGTISNVYAILDWRDKPGLAVGLSAGLMFVGVPILHLVFAYGIYRVRTFAWKKYVSQPESDTNIQLKSIRTIENASNDRETSVQTVNNSSQPFVHNLIIS